MIAAAGALDDNVQAQIGYIRDAANRLTEMVDDLVSDAMADALDITIRREPIDLAVLVEEVAEANRPLAARKDADDCRRGPARSCGDVRCRPDPRGHRQPGQQRHQIQPDRRSHRPLGGAGGRRYSRRGQGSGAGLSPEDISRLFGRFQRLSAKPTAGETSTGLGLSIVKRIVDLHGGRIAVESAGPGKGATFKMTLPDRHEPGAAHRRRR